MPNSTRDSKLVQTLSLRQVSPACLRSQMLHVWWLSTGVVGDVWDMLSDEERRAAARFHHRVNQQRFAAAHAGLRVLLGHYLGMAPRRVVIVREPCQKCGVSHGKPVLAGDRPPLHFSISHAEGVTLYAISLHRIGVDVESENALADPGAILPYMTPSERGSLGWLSPSERTRAALRCWVRKEAYVKATGEGISLDLAKIDVGVCASNRSIQPARFGDWWIFDLSALEGFVASVAAPYRDIQVSSAIFELPRSARRQAL